MATVATSPGGSTDTVWIGAASPLLSYTPRKNASAGSSWVTTPQGYSQCEGSDTYAVELCELTYSSLVWSWVSSQGTVGVGLDGQLEQGSASSGAVTLNGAFANHTARLTVKPGSANVVGCTHCGGDDRAGGIAGFQLIGARINTRLVASGRPVNTTVDDASPLITYSGFDSVSTSSAQLDAIRNGKFYQNTVSYTSSAGASASFSFQGTALYVFGPTGQTFQTFQLTIDGVSFGPFDAGTTVNTYDTLLFFASGLNEGNHQVVVTNQADGGMFALDYFVAVSSATTGSPPPVAGTITSTAVLPGATAVFGDAARSDAGTGSQAGVIGGILGAIFGLIFLFIAWRYYKYRKAGGEGDFFAALCGPRKKPAPQVAGPAKNDFKIWPMMRFRPKYAT